MIGNFCFRLLVFPGGTESSLAFPDGPCVSALAEAVPQDGWGPNWIVQGALVRISILNFTDDGRTELMEGEDDALGNIAEGGSTSMASDTRDFSNEHLAVGWHDFVSTSQLAESGFLGPDDMICFRANVSYSSARLDS